VPLNHYRQGTKDPPSGTPLVGEILSHKTEQNGILWFLVRWFGADSRYEKWNTIKDLLDINDKRWISSVHATASLIFNLPLWGLWPRECTWMSNPSAVSGEDVPIQGHLLHISFKFFWRLSLSLYHCCQVRIFILIFFFGSCQSAIEHHFTSTHTTPKQEHSWGMLHARGPASTLSRELCSMADWPFFLFYDRLVLL
jgi:hypothetical protein